MLNSNLLKEAMKEFNGCELFEEREKGDFDAIVGVQLTIEQYQKLSDYFVVLFEEDKEHFYLSGGALTKLLDKYGDDDACVGNVVSFGDMVKTSNKRDYRPMTIIK